MVRNTFYGLNISASGLFASQQGIELTGHNIANADTNGYTRQRLVQAAVDPYAGNSFYAPISRAISGRGVDVLYIDQIRDQFLDRQYRRENSSSYEWGVKADALYFIEDIFNGIGTTGIDVGLKNLLSALQEFDKNPETKAVRTNLKQEALKLAETIQHNYKQLIDYQDEQNRVISTQVDRVNAIAAEIKELNERIYKFEMSGAHANDLRDKRNLLMDELSSLVDIEYYSTQDAQGWEQLHVEIKNGTGSSIELVNHDTVTKLFVDAKKANPVSTETGVMFYEIYYQDTSVTPPINVKLDMSGHTGEIKAHMDLRDGTGGTEFKGIPYYAEELNKFAKALVESFNAANAAGYTYPYETTDALGNTTTISSQTGLNMFDPTKANAKEICLSAAILESVFNFASSSVKVSAPGTPVDEQTGNNLNIKKLIDVLSEKISGLGGSFGDFYQSFLAEIGTEASAANKRSEGQTVLMNSLYNQRLSISGVSIDEEMTMLIKYQHSYSANARVITAVDEMLDVMINRMGLVGRS